MTRSKRAIANALGLLLAAGLQAASGPLAPPAAGGASTYRIAPARSRVGFSISKWRIFRKEGIFRDFHGEIAIDWENPPASRVEVTVEAASLDTREPHRDETVRSADFLDVRRHPTLTFRSLEIAPGRAGLYDVTGDLTIRGITRRVTVPVRVAAAAAASEIRFRARFEIRRTDFGVDGTRWSGGKAILGDEVSIALDLAADRIGEPDAARSQASR
jgi:polyisoprenoid-binding protein YceI